MPSSPLQVGWRDELTTALGTQGMLAEVARFFTAYCAAFHQQIARSRGPWHREAGHGTCLRAGRGHDKAAYDRKRRRCPREAHASI
jgi:hypothetical protein